MASKVSVTFDDADLAALTSRTCWPINRR